MFLVTALEVYFSFVEICKGKKKKKKKEGSGAGILFLLVSEVSETVLSGRTEAE